MKKCGFANEMKATHVYLFQCNDGLIKVGVAKNVKKRLANLQNANAGKLSILRSIRVGKGMAFAIESGFKKLMHSCNKRGEWFKCSDILAIVALYVVEHGDLIGYTAVHAGLTAADGDWSRSAFDEYAWDLYRRFPDHFKLANYWHLTTLDPDFTVLPKRRQPPWPNLRSRIDVPKPQLRINIYPDDWNNARLEANRRRKAVPNGVKSIL